MTDDDKTPELDYEEYTYKRIVRRASIARLGEITVSAKSAGNTVLLGLIRGEVNDRILYMEDARNRTEYLPGGPFNYQLEMLKNLENPPQVEASEVFEADQALNQPEAEVAHGN